MNILIVEDERKTAELLKEFIESAPLNLVVDILDSISTAVDFLKKYQEKIDLLFLDIQLADGQAFTIFDRIQVNVPVVFCTAFDAYVLDAFKNNGIDYILKPFAEEDIFAALKKYDKLKLTLSKDIVSENERIRSVFHVKNIPPKSFIVHYREKMIPVSIENIAFFNLENEAVRIYCFNKETYSLFKRMDEIQSALDDAHFFRINRQMIIHRKAVKEIEPYFNRKLIITTTFPVNEEIIVSRLKVSPFLKWLEHPE